MSTKHTPGPWEYSRMRLTPRCKDRRSGFVVNGPDDDGEPSLPARICDMRVPTGVDGFAEGEANARLIAAAPDLLAACENFIEQWDKHGVTASGFYQPIADAIARAKGAPCSQT